MFSLSANAGAALAASVVQPGAVGLETRGTVDPPDRGGDQKTELGFNGQGLEAGSGGDGGSGRRAAGVVFESLDSKILEAALVSAMGRLGLGVRSRSR